MAKGILYMSFYDVRPYGRNDLKFVKKCSNLNFTVLLLFEFDLAKWYRVWRVRLKILNYDFLTFEF